MKDQIIIRFAMAAFLTLAAAVTVAAVNSEEARADCTMGVDC